MMIVNINRDWVDHLCALHRKDSQWNTADTLEALRDALDRAEARLGTVAAIANQCSWDKKSRDIASKLHDAIRPDREGL